MFADPQMLGDVKRHLTVAALEVENEGGLNPLQLALTCGDGSCAAILLDSLSDTLSTLTGQELSTFSESVNRILTKADKESGKTILHLAAEYAPELVDQILDLSEDPDALLRAKDKRNLLAAHYNQFVPSLLAPLEEMKGGMHNPHLTDIEAHELSESIELHKEIADGNSDPLRVLFLEDEYNVYKRIDTVDGRKSILEVAAESGQPDIVRFILKEHKKLREKEQKVIEEVTVELSELSTSQAAGVDRRVSDLRTQLTDSQHRQRAISRECKEQLNSTLLGALTKQKSAGWHQGIIKGADLTQEGLVASLLDSGMNPVVTAVQSGNNPVAAKILGEAPLCANSDLEQCLIERRDVEGLLKGGFGLKGFYEADYIPPEETEETKADFDSAVATQALIHSEMDRLGAKVTSKFGNKGALLSYAHAVSMDNREGDNVKEKLEKFKGGDKSLLSIKSPDGHNLGTFLAAFGSIAQWEHYAGKYNKLQRSDRGTSPAGDMSADIGSPAQVVILAKYFAEGPEAKRRRANFFDYLMSSYPPDIQLSNEDGENLLHTIVRCGDLDALELVMGHDAYLGRDLTNALDHKNNSGRNPIELAAYMGNTSVMKAILENAMARKGPGAAATLLRGSQLMHVAVANGDSGMIKFIAEMQQMLNIALAPQVLCLEKQRDSSGRDPFILAIETGHVSSVSAMLDAGFVMERKSVKEALMRVSAVLKEDKLEELSKLLELSGEEKGKLWDERARQFASNVSSEVAEPLRAQSAPQPEKTLENYGKEVRRLAREDSAVFPKKSFHVVGNVLSSFQQEFNQNAASLEGLIKSGNVSEVLQILRGYPGVIDSSENRSGIITAVLDSGNSEMLKLLVKNSNKFLKNQAGDNLLHEIISHGCKESSIHACMQAGYSLAEVSDNTNLSAFELIELENTALAAALKKNFDEDFAERKNLMGSFNRVLESANAGEKSEIVSSLCKDMNAAKKGYNFPVLSHIFNEIASETHHGDHSLMKKRLALVHHMLGKLSYFEERHPQTGDTIPHMLFRVLVRAPFSITEVKDALNSLLQNRAFSHELFLEKNADGVSPMDILARSKHSGSLLEKIHSSCPGLREKISLSRLLMISVLNADIGTTESLLALHGHNIDLNAVDCDGISSMECAVRNNSLEMVKLLLEHGAEINAVDSNDRNILDRILDRALEDRTPLPQKMVSFLVERGINLEHCSAGLTTLERFNKLELYRNQQRARYTELLEKNKLSNSEYTELRVLQGAKLNTSVLDLLYSAQVSRTRISQDVNKQVACALYKTSNIRFFKDVSHLPGILGAPFRLPEGKSSASLIGAALHVKIDHNASVDIDKLIGGVSKDGIRRSNLSFNGGETVVELQKRSDGLVNYVPKKGSIVVSGKAKVNGERMVIHMRIGSDGSVSFDPKSHKDILKLNALAKENKIDFHDSKIYVNGMSLEKAFKASSERSPEKRQLQDAARALREAGALTAEDKVAQQQPPAGRAQQGRQQRADSV